MFIFCSYVDAVLALSGRGVGGGAEGDGGEW